MEDNRVDSPGHEQGNGAVNVTQSGQNSNGYLMEGQPSVQQQNNYGSFNGLQYAASSGNNQPSLSAIKVDNALSLLIDGDYSSLYPPGRIGSAPSASSVEALGGRLRNLRISSPSSIFVPNRYGLTDRVSYNVLSRTGLFPKHQSSEQIWSNSAYRGGASSSDSAYRSNSFYAPHYDQNNGSYMASSSRASSQLARNSNIYCYFRNNSRNVMSGDVSLRRPFDYSRLSLRSLSGMFAGAAKKLPFSKFWRHALETASQEDIDMVISELSNELVGLSTHPSATHMVQKLIERCSDPQRTEILTMMINSDFLMLCIHELGSHALRQLVKFLKWENQFTLFVTALCLVLFQVTRNINGHRLLQDCLKHFPFYYNQVILIEASKHSTYMAMDQHACFLLQEFIRDSPDELKVYFITNIIRNVAELSDNRYGNYVVQFVLGLGNQQFTTDLVQQLRGHYANLSRSKYGSHVVQMCLQDTTLEHAEMIIRELMNDPDIFDLSNHPFGNFIMQSALTVAKQSSLYLYLKLKELVEKKSQMMNTNRYGQRVCNCIERLNRGMNNPIYNFRML